MSQVTEPTLNCIADTLINACGGAPTLTQARVPIRIAIADGILPRQLDAQARRVVALAAARLTIRAARREAREIAMVKPLADRLVAHRHECDWKVKVRVLNSVDGLYRVSKCRWAGGEHVTQVVVGEHVWRSYRKGTEYPAVGVAVGAKGESARAWSSNGKWSGNNSRHTIQVRRDWLQRVNAINLAVCDGMLTLDAEPIQGSGPELYRATWVEQARGFMICAVNGYIARIGEVTYHAGSARAALDGVQRKAGLKPSRRAGVIDLDKIARRYGDLPVTWEDGKAVGACDSGLRSWCNAVGISTGGCTLDEVVAGYKLRPTPEAISVIRRVVRDRHNRHPLDLASLNGAAKLIGDGRIVYDNEGGFRIEGE